jgi:phosphodiesterase/alkaline phosphatase D-like protein
MLGEAQLAWLRKGLKESRAHFKIIAAPCTLWGDDPAKPDADSWTRFPAEQNAFVDWLGAQKINGVITLAGNRPAGEITKVKFDSMVYPLYTVATSALCLPEGARFAAPPENPNRVVAPVSASTFGTLDFGGDHEHRFITLRLRDEKGKVRAEQTLFAVQLKN